MSRYESESKPTPLPADGAGSSTFQVGVPHMSAETSLGVPSSSFLCAAGAGAPTTSDSNSFDSRRLNPLLTPGSSDSGNFFRASQPTSSDMGLSPRERRQIQARYAPRSALSAFHREAAPFNVDHQRRRNSETAQQQQQQQKLQQQNPAAGRRRVMAKLNQTGSQIRETQLPSFIVVNTPFSGMVADNQGFSRRRQQQQEETRRRHGDGGAVSRRGGTRNQNNASVENRGAATDIDEPMEVDRSGVALFSVSDRSPASPMYASSPSYPSSPASPAFNSGRHSPFCNTNFNKEAACNCEIEGQRKLGSDVRTDIVPPRRRREKRNSARNFDEEDCGESPWNWHVDAKWGCQKYPEVYYCDEDCPSLLEYLLCPEDETCEEDDEWHEWTRNADAIEEPDLDAVITLRQGESGDYEVRNLNVLKKGLDDFTVTWKHPPGDHPTYVVVVYPPADSGPSKAGGPDCGACAEEEECMCSMQPVFRMHVDGAQTQCDFPVECFEAGKTFIVEVATLNTSRDESFGTSLVLVDVYELNK